MLSPARKGPEAETLYILQPFLDAYGDEAHVWRDCGRQKGQRVSMEAKLRRDARPIGSCSETSVED
ncbi:hypothetical protein E2C01_032669 [Portunus trituberculatus]|uniref:Uncharacterized protein n=1 Tax=Portunus trituberculatus TaxID=210409 RepID=A0A5B7F111_PORTR|nr:hypothetical protein [Portunus trituberculatus]